MKKAKWVSSQFIEILCSLEFYVLVQIKTLVKTQALDLAVEERFIYIWPNYVQYIYFWYNVTVQNIYFFYYHAEKSPLIHL